MTAAERLLHISGATGTAAALLMSVGAGATTGEILVSYSRLGSAAAAEHIMTDIGKANAVVTIFRRFGRR